MTANSDWLATQPAAAKLLDLVELLIVDVSLANVEQSSGKDTDADIIDLATAWITNNRGTVDARLSEVVAAAG